MLHNGDIPFTDAISILPAVGPLDGVAVGVGACVEIPGGNADIGVNVQEP